MTSKQEKLKSADAEIDAFDEWFRGEGASPLARFEKAILKTFLVARASGKFRSPLAPVDSPTSFSEEPSLTPAPPISEP